MQLLFMPISDTNFGEKIVSVVVHLQFSDSKLEISTAYNFWFWHHSVNGYMHQVVHHHLWIFFGVRKNWENWDPRVEDSHRQILELRILDWNRTQDRQDWEARLTSTSWHLLDVGLNNRWSWPARAFSIASAPWTSSLYEKAVRSWLKKLTNKGGPRSRSSRSCAL